MSDYSLSKSETMRRKKIAENTRKMMFSILEIEDQDETSLLTAYRGYYLQISFSELHPLMVFCLAKTVEHIGGTRQFRNLNELNLKSILGSHSVNKSIGCYSYRSTHWLNDNIEPQRFFEILDRCVDEADKGYRCVEDLP